MPEKKKEKTDTRGTYDWEKKYILYRYLYAVYTATGIYTGIQYLPW